MSPFNNPINSEKADRLIALLDVEPDSRVIDIGCGRGEFLMRVVEAGHASGFGLDSDANAIAAACAIAQQRLPETSACEFRVGDAQREPFEDASYDLVICLGSTHAFGMGDTAFPNTLTSAFRILRPGGQLLVGEGYWKQPPAPEYLQFLGEPVGIYRDHVENIAFAEERGWIPLYATVSSEDEWDHFEWSHRMRIEREAGLQPIDGDVSEKLERSRAWRDGYLRWGRATMGFGFYLFAKPAAAP